MNAEPYVVVLRQRGRRGDRSADVVDARSPEEAARVALEGERWDTDDGRYDVHVARLADLQTLTAKRQTDVSVTVEGLAPA